MENEVKRREWVKTAAIIFLSVLLVLTFFSNTILNASLIAVSAQQVSGGSIRARITGNGMVSANETYDVTIKQTRKVASIKARVGREVTEGEVLFVLEAEESEELKAAQETLNSLQLDYDRSMIALGNTSATNNREVEKLQKAYDEAVEAYRKYSGADPALLEADKAQAESNIRNMNAQKTQLQNSYTELSKDPEYTALSGQITELQTAISEQEGIMSKLEQTMKEIPAASASVNIIDSEIRDCNITIAEYENGTHIVGSVPVGERLPALLVKHEQYYGILSEIADKRHDVMDSYCENDSLLKQKLELGGYAATTGKELEELLGLVKEAHRIMDDYYRAGDDLVELEQERDYVTARDTTKELTREKGNVQSLVSSVESRLNSMQSQMNNLDAAIADEQAELEKIKEAASAAETVKAAKQALEDKIFEVNLGTTDGLDLDEKKRKIEQAQKDVDELIANADEMEIKAPVSGVVESINISAGREAAKDDTLMTICLQDRGYTVQIPVTSEQAKRVKVGDTADTDMFFTNITATLESIQPDPNNKNSGKLLVFRLEGDVTPGQNLRLSIGQKSQNYDCLVPKSAVASDANGKYVLAVKVKQTPLKDRYIAQRVEVQVIAEDDTNSAVSGLEAGTFVIVTSSSPSLKAGDEIRLSENAG